MSEEKKDTLVIALVGAPGAGKSTLAANIFSKLKMQGVNAELVTEFAKDKVWEENKAVFENQFYIFAKQYFKMSRCIGKTDVIVTDSPLILGAFYANDPDIQEPFTKIVQTISAKYRTQYWFVNRVKKYNPIGRLQTEAESDEYSVKIKKMLTDFGIGFKEINGDFSGADVVVESALKDLA